MIWMALVLSLPGLCGCGAQVVRDTRTAQDVAEPEDRQVEKTGPLVVSPRRPTIRLMEDRCFYSEIKHRGRGLTTNRMPRTIYLARVGRGRMLTLSRKLHSPKGDPRNWPVVGTMRMELPLRCVVEKMNTQVKAAAEAMRKEEEQNRNNPVKTYDPSFPQMTSKLMRAAIDNARRSRGPLSLDDLLSGLDHRRLVMKIVEEVLDEGKVNIYLNDRPYLGGKLFKMESHYNSGMCYRRGSTQYFTQDCVLLLELHVMAMYKYPPR